MNPIALLCLLTLSLTGCSTVSSSLHYTKGTQYLDQGDYAKAVEELEQAVAIDPRFARNHTNLASAYANLGLMDKAWFQTRQAMLSPYRDQVGAILFATLYRLLVIEAGLDQPGTCLTTVVDQLGTPDITLISSDGVSLQYGACRMEFKEDKLVSCQLLFNL